MFHRPKPSVKNSNLQLQNVYGEEHWLVINIIFIIIISYYQLWKKNETKKRRHDTIIIIITIIAALEKCTLNHLTAIRAREEFKWPIKQTIAKRQSNISLDEYERRYTRSHRRRNRPIIRCKQPTRKITIQTADGINLSFLNCTVDCLYYNAYNNWI